MTTESKTMTDAEKEVLESALKDFNPAYDTQGPLNAALLRLTQERTPPEFEQTLRALCFRAFEALDAAAAYEQKSPLGGLLKSQFRREYEEAKAGSR